MAHVLNLDHYGESVTKSVVARIRAAMADHRAYIALHDELSALSDRELADIGISRLNVRDVARDAVYGN